MRSLFISQVVNIVIGSFLVMIAWNYVVVELFEIGTVNYVQAILVMMAVEALCALPIRDAKLVEKL